MKFSRVYLLSLILSIVSINAPTTLHAQAASVTAPQPPYTSNVVSTYIWQVLLPELQANMKLYPTFTAYQAAVVKLQQLYQQAAVTTDSNQLAQILSQAQSLANPSQNVPPDVAAAQQQAALATQTQLQVDQTVTQLAGSIDALNRQTATLEIQFANYQQTITTESNPSASAVGDLQKAQSDLAQAQAQLTPLLNSKSTLTQFQTSFDQQVQNILSLAQQIENGIDPNGTNLQTLEGLMATLMQNQSSFQQGLNTTVSSQIASFSNLLSTTLANDMTALQNDVGGGIPAAQGGQSCYIDMGSMSAQFWGFMNYNPTVSLNMAMYDQYMQSLFTQLNAAQVTQINLSFAQIGSIDSLLNDGQNAPADDVIAQMLVSFPGSLQEMIRLAHANGIKVDLAMGGENGSSMTIASLGETPQGQAQKLVQFMQNYQIDSIDFDFESTAFTDANSSADAVAFFTALHQGLMAQNKVLTLTIEGSISDWPENFLKELFYDQNGKLIFFNLFDQLNLMLYSTSQYYIDANNDTWGIEQWLNLLGKQNAGAVHIGFEDGVDYTNPAASAGGKYVINTTSSGAAAAEIFQQLQQQLIQDGYTTPLGSCFFWPDVAVHAPGAGIWSRYQAFTANNVTSMNFDTVFMNSFASQLSSSK